MKKKQKIVKEVDLLYRDNFGKMVASLATLFGLSNLKIAEDLVQDTFIAALNEWSKNGSPRKPIDWLFKVCKNKTLNELKKSHYRKTSSSTIESLYESGSIGMEYKVNQVFLEDEINDNQLRLLFATCHPAIPIKSQIILALKSVVGFKMEEISQGLGMSLEAVKKSIYRTRNLIKEEHINIYVPYIRQSEERLGAVEMVLYLMFNEGYKASSGDHLIKKELCLEAMKLTKALMDMDLNVQLTTKALFSLMLFNVARFEARSNATINSIDLEEQDRNKWDKDLMELGLEYFNDSKPLESNSRFHIEAGIASIHCLAKKFEHTDWGKIIKLYDQLGQINKSPFVQLSRCVAIYYEKGAEDALQEIEKAKLHQELENYYLFHITLGKIYFTLTDHEKAIDHYLTALHQAKIEPDRLFIKSKIDEIRNQMILSTND